VRAIAVPVLEDALSRSLLLAAAMDSRGYGRSGTVPARLRRATSALLLAGLVGLCLGLYALIDPTAPGPLGLPTLLLGVALCGAGLALGGRGMQRSTYRPDPWRAPEWLVAGCGLASAAVMIVAGHADPSLLHPSLYPLRWPALPVIPLAGVLVGLLPAWLTPEPAVRARPVYEVAA
jgi:energy-coupling factor transport system permease protein